MSDYQTLLYSRSAAVVSITLNRPDAANGINDTLAVELADAARRCEADDSIKAVILTAQGRLFCAGGDVNAMAAYGDQVSAKLKTLADTLHQALLSFDHMAAVLITAVNGAAAGAGFSLAIAGDLCIASREASFCMAYSKIGLTPDGGASYKLPRLVGLRKAQELMLTNKTLSAEQAQHWGLINNVVEADQLIPAAQKLAQQFAQGAGFANGSIRQLLAQSWSNNYQQQLALEANTISAAGASEAGREGIEAFVQKRQPNYK
jgi:2-(1,2-epoxy-1,2-dihydrophenyl)acetyl-CoA isomerase